MKKRILSIVIFLSILVSGCFSANEENSEVESRWKLVETRVSIGGPAEYVPADKEEFIEFLSDSKIRNSNGWCGEGSEKIVSYSEDGTINTNCNGNGKLLFGMEDDYLVLRNPSCIEACDYKYERIVSRSE